MAAGDVRASLVLNLRGNLAQGLDATARRFQRVAQTGQRSVGMLGRTATLAAGGLDRLGNRYVALATGAGAVATGRFLVSQQRRLTMLGIAANLGADEVQRLNQQVYETAQLPDVRVNPDQILQAVEAIVEKTGDLDFARENLRNLGLAIAATGGETGAAIGEITAEFQKMGMVDPSRILQAVDTLNVQGKEGAFTLKELAALGPRVVTVYSGAVKGARDGLTMITEMGAALQSIRQATGSSEQAATAFERLLSELQDAQKQKLFKRLGIDIFTVGKDGEKALRPINELMEEIFAKTGGDRTQLGTLFGDEAIRAFAPSAIASLDKYMAVQGDGTQTMADAARTANDLAGALTNLGTAFKRFSESNGVKPIRAVADVLNSLSSDRMQKVLGVAGAGAVGLGGLVLGRKAYKGGRALYQGVRGLFGGPAGIAADTAQAARPFNPYSGMGVPPPAKAGGRFSRAARGTGRALGGAAQVAGAFGLGYTLGEIVVNPLIELSDEKLGTHIGDTIGATVAKTLAFFGNDAAKAAVAATERGRDPDANAGRESNIRLTVGFDRDFNPRIRDLRADLPGFALEVGPTMAGY